jgi:hypothetical protein
MLADGSNTKRNPPDGARKVRDFARIEQSTLAWRRGIMQQQALQNSNG